MSSSLDIRDGAEAAQALVAYKLPVSWREAVVEHYVVFERDKLISKMRHAEVHQRSALREDMAALSKLTEMLDDKSPRMRGPKRPSGPVSQQERDAYLSRLLTPARWREVILPIFQTEFDSAIDKMTSGPDTEYGQHQAYSNRVHGFIRFLEQVESKGRQAQDKALGVLKKAV